MAVHAASQAEPGYFVSWWSMLDGVQDSVSNAIQSGVLTGRPEVHCLDVSLHVGSHCMIAMEPLLGVLPSLPTNWQRIAGRQVHALASFAAEVRAVGFFGFPMLRRKHSTIPRDNPLTLLCKASVRVVTFLLEVAVELGVQETIEKCADRLSPVLGLFGPSQRTKSHHTPLAKTVAMQSCSSTHGSNETVMVAQGHVKGASSQLRSAKLTIYKD